MTSADFLALLPIIITAATAVVILLAITIRRPSPPRCWCSPCSVSPAVWWAAGSP